MKFCDEKIQNHLLKGGKIKRRDFDVEVGLNKEKRLSCDCSKYYILTQYDLIYDEWEIVETNYNWDKIIKDKILCIFSDDKDFKDEIISILTNVDEDYYYTTNKLWFKYCKPFDQEKFNIVKDIREYEE